MWKLISTIQKHLTIAIPFMMLSGFLFGWFYDSEFLKSLIMPLTILMVYPMMVNLNMSKVFEKGDTKAQLFALGINFLILPFGVFAVGLIFFTRENPYMLLGILLAGLVPTSGMTISWTGFAKGNVEAAVKMTVAGLAIGSAVTPFYVKFLMGTAITINVVQVFNQIILIVFIPMIAGVLTRKFLVKRYGITQYSSDIGPKFPALSTLGVVGIVFVAMALKAKAIGSSPEIILYILIPVSIIYGANFLFSTIVAKLFLNRGDGIALVYGTVMRNLSIALAIAINAFGTEGSTAALVVAAAYIVQVQSAAWYVKLTPYIFGEKSLKTQTKQKTRKLRFFKKKSDK
ncbi:MAG: bile acid:sodium symporter [Desulforegulaceae bacterium]|nr:bile acid:sodium symporter [Desulforegulaceae bacterium]